MFARHVLKFVTQNRSNPATDKHRHNLHGPSVREDSVQPPCPHALPLEIFPTQRWGKM